MGAVRLLALLLTFCYANAFASGVPTSVVFQGKILQPGDVPLEAASVDFNIRILDPGAGCILHEENFTGVDMTNSDGLFSLDLGTGTRVDGQAHSFLQSFENNRVFPATGPCGAGYTPTTGDHRLVRLQFDAGTPIVVTPNAEIKAVPYAYYAESLQGMSASEFLQVNTGGANVLSQANLQGVFSTPNYTELLALLAGTSSNYMQTSPGADVSFNNNKITDVSDPTNAQDASTKNYADTNVGGTAASVTGVSGVAGDGRILTWDQGNARWEAKDPAFDGSDITTGTIDKDRLPTTMNAITMSGDLDMNGNNILNSGYITMNDDTYLHLGRYDDTAENALVTTPLTAAHEGVMWYDEEDDTIEYWDGTAVVVVGAGAGSGTLDDAYDNGAATVTVDGTGGGDVVWNLTSTNDFKIQDAGADAFVVLDNGNVGIGLSNPDDALDISGGNLNVSGGNNIIVDNGYISANFGGSYKVAMNAQTADGYISIRDSTNTTRVGLDSNGNSYFTGGSLGVGLIDPLNGDLDGTPAISISGTAPRINLNQSADLNANGTLSELVFGGLDPRTSSSVNGRDMAAIEAYWTGFGGDTLDTDLIFRTSSGGTSSAEKMRILSTGEVGIGTATPGGKLHVSGGELILDGTGAYLDYKPNNTACSNNEVLKWSTANDRWECGTDNAGAGAQTMDETYDQGTNTVAVDAQDMIWNLTSTQDFRVQDNGTDAFVVLDDGNVGVGLTTPTELIDVSGASAPTIRLTATDASNANLEFANTSAGRGMTVGLSHAAGNDLLNFIGQTAGIGTYVRVTAQAGQNANLALYGDGGGLSATLAADVASDSFLLTNNAANGDIRLRTDIGGGGVVSAVHIEGTDGNVGIGYNTPISKLQIAGDLNVGYQGENVNRRIVIHSTNVAHKTGQIYHDGMGMVFTYGVGNQSLKLGEAGVAWMNGIHHYGGDHVFYNASTELARITSAGNVGIGTATPTTGAILDVAGTGAAQSSMIVPRDTTANRPGTGVNGMLRYNTTSNKFEGYEGGAWVDFVQAAGSSNTLDGAYDEGGAGAGRAITVDTGAVQFTGSNAADETVEITNSGNGGALFVENAGTGDSFRVNDEASDTTPFVIDDEGNVGVGVAAPSQALHVTQNGDGFAKGIRVDSISNNVDISTWSGGAIVDSSEGLLLRGATDVEVQVGGSAGDVFAVETNMLVVEGDTGNVGIGTASPGETLDVEGNIVVNGTTPTLRLGAASESDDWSISHAQTGNNNNHLLFTRDGGVKAHIKGDGGAYFNGAVGVGTATPTAGALLDLTGTGAALSSVLIPRDTTANRPTGVNGMIRYNTTSNKFEGYEGGAWVDFVQAAGSSNTLDGAYDEGGAGAGRAITVDTGAVQFTGSNAADETVEITNSGNGGALFVENAGTGDSFRVNDEASDASPFVIDDAGNVGIGTANPGLPLDVEVAAGPVMTRFRGNRGTINVSLATQDFYNTTNHIARIEAVTGVSSFNEGQLAFHTRNSGGLAERLRVTEDGNVGVGTTTPAARLQIDRGDSHELLNLNQTVPASFNVDQVWSDDGTTRWITSVRTASDDDFWFYNAGRTTADLVIDDATGAVGFQTNTPTAGSIADFNGTGTTLSSIIVPRDTTANRPTTGVNGMIRYNVTTNTFEGYENGAWVDMRGGGSFGTGNSGFVGSLQYASAANCFWSTTASGAYTNFAADADCPSATVEGAALAPDTAKTPAVKFASLPAGRYRVSMFNAVGLTITAGTTCEYVISDGTTNQGHSLAMNNVESGFGYMTGEFSYTSAQSNITFNVQARRLSGTGPCRVYNQDYEREFTLSVTRIDGNGSAIELADNDGDTRVQVEESSDEDIIRFDTAGTERMNIDASGNINVSGGFVATGTVDLTGATITDGAISVDDLDFASAAGGINIPQLASAPTGSTEGQMYFNTGDKKLYVWNGTAWTEVGSGSGGGGSVGPSFSVHKNGTNQTVTPSTNTLLTFSTELFDTNNNFSGNRFTPTVAGKYIVTVSVGCTGATACVAMIYKNGASWKQSYTNAPINSHVVETTAVIDMNGTTDYIEAWGHSGGTNIMGSSIATYFTGSLVGGGGSGLGDSNGIDVPTLASAPSSPDQGQMYYNTGDDKLYVWDGSAWQEVGSGASSGGGGLVSVQVFTSSGTWNRPSGVTHARVIVVGGGGGGGGANAADGTQAAAGQGGGGGGTAEKFIDVSGIASATITVGAGGTAGASSNGAGGNGGDSIWSDGTNTLTGGGGDGPSATASAGGPMTSSSGSGGTASGGDLNIPGGGGGVSLTTGDIVYAYHVAISGEGGASTMSTNAKPVGTRGNGAASTVGNPGLAYGGGGSGGASRNGGSAVAGGAGASGVVVVYEYSNNGGIGTDGIDIPTLASAPSSPDQGQMYYNTGDDKLYVWDGSAWQEVGSGAGGGGDVSYIVAAGNYNTGNNADISANDRLEITAAGTVEGTKITADVGNNLINLKAGSSYMISTLVEIGGTSTSFWMYYDVWNYTAGSSIKGSAMVTTVDNNSKNSSNGRIMTIFKPSVDTDVGLRVQSVGPGLNDVRTEWVIHELGGGGGSNLGDSNGVDVPTLTSAPGSPDEGQMYYNTTDDKLYVWDGSSWQEVGTGVGTPVVAIVRANGFTTSASDTGYSAGNYLSGTSFDVTGTAEGVPLENSGGHFNATNGKFTAPRTGYYLASLRLTSITGALGNRYLYLHSVNGLNPNEFLDGEIAGCANCPDEEGTAVIRLNAGETHRFLRHQSYANVGTAVISYTSIDGASSRNTVVDADGDTQIQVEETGDEDIIRFDTGGTERVQIAANGFVGIGTNNPDEKLSVDGDSWASIRSRVFSNSDYAGLILSRARGTQAGALTVADNDTVGTLVARGYNGTGWGEHARIDFEVDGATIGVGDAPGRIVLKTAPDGTAVPQPRMTIKEDGYVGIGLSDPTTHLNVMTDNNAATEGMRIESPNGSRISLFSDLGVDFVSGITATGDAGLFFSDGTIETGGFVISPWTAETIGFRMDNEGFANFRSETSTATASEQYGLRLNARYNVADTSYKQGIRSDTYADHTSGTIDNLNGVMITARNGNAGTITNAAGLWSRVDNLNASGTITNAFGVYISGSNNVGTITNDYGLYQAGTTAKNYFAGNLGIKTDDPAYELDVQGRVASSHVGDNSVYLEATDGSGGYGSRLRFGGGGTNPNAFQIQGLGDVAAVAIESGWVGVGTTDNSGGRMTIDGSAIGLTLKAGPTADHVYMRFYADSAAQTTRSAWFGYGGVGTNHLSLNNEMSGGNIILDPNGGMISVPGTHVSADNGYAAKAGNAGAYSGNTFHVNWVAPNAQLWIDSTNIGTFATLSDYRFKHDVIDFDESGLDNVMKLRPVKYRWKDKGVFKDDGIHHSGFIAHELKDVLPTAVVGEKDAVDKEGNEIAQNIVTLEIFPTLVKAIQELYQKVLDIIGVNDEQDRRIANVEEENERLKEENQQLKSYLCQKDPEAPFCQ